MIYRVNYCNRILYKIIACILLSTCLDSYSNEELCLNESEGIKVCAFSENKPFGKISYEKKYNASGEVIFAKFKGINSGFFLFSDINIIYSDGKGWSIRDSKSKILMELTGEGDFYFEYNNFLWQLDVKNFFRPIHQHGVATEEENQISITIKRLN
jgi:hypothetical protein